VASGDWTLSSRATDFGTTTAMVELLAAKPGSHHSNPEPGGAEARPGTQPARVPWTVNRPADVARLIDWKLDGRYRPLIACAP
jgi:hypothetical protein